MNGITFIFQGFEVVSASIGFQHVDHYRFGADPLLAPADLDDALYLNGKPPSNRPGDVVVSLYL